MSQGNKVILGIGAAVLLLSLAVDSYKKQHAPAPIAAPAPSPAPARVAESSAVTDARLETCRAKLKTAAAIGLVTNMTFDDGRPKVWVGRPWQSITIDAKTEFARTAACFFLAGKTDQAITFPIYDGFTGKQIATWKYTRLAVE